MPSLSPRQFIHITTPDVAAKLHAGEPFKPGSGYQGDGVYVTQDREANHGLWGGIVRDKLEDMGRGHEDPVDVPVKLDVDPDKMFHREVWAHRKVREDIEHGASHLLPQYDKNVTSATEEAERRSPGRVHATLEQNAMHKTLKDAGYQGMHIEHQDADETVVWDPKRVKVMGRQFNERCPECGDPAHPGIEHDIG